jgi:hypothetical protein
MINSEYILAEVSENNPPSIWSKFILTLIFITVTPITLIICMFSLFVLNKSDSSDIYSNKYIETANTLPSGVRVYASLPSSYPNISTEISSTDARPEIVRQYLEKYNSPLEPYSNVIVENADKYGLDFRLTTAIAQQESNLCKHSPAGCNNCWGFGIHSQGTLCFDSYEQGVETVSSWLRTQYLNKGLITVDEVMNKYTPLSKGSWAAGVNQFMEEMQ